MGSLIIIIIIAFPARASLSGFRFGFRFRSPGSTFQIGNPVFQLVDYIINIFNIVFLHLESIINVIFPLIEWPLQIWYCCIIFPFFSSTPVIFLKITLVSTYNHKTFFLILTEEAYSQPRRSPDIGVGPNPSLLAWVTNGLTCQPAPI